jgi:hypothetical protein
LNIIVSCCIYLSFLFFMPSSGNIVTL